MSKNIIVYRDRLFCESERSFLLRQYCGFSRLKPHWMACHFVSKMPDDQLGFLIGRKTIFGKIDRFLFKQFGIVYRDELIELLRPVVVHAQFGRGGALALPLARYFKIPLVVTFHGGDVFKEKHYKRKLIPTIFQRRWYALINYTSVFVCVSEEVRSQLVIRGVPFEKTVVMPIGTDYITPILSVNKPKHMLFVGRFVEKKGILVLIEAIKRLRSVGVQTEFVFVGDGELRGVVKAALQGICNIRLTGWLSMREVRSEMQNAIALVVPSCEAKNGDREGLPSVAVEAMGLSIPIVASDKAGLTSILTVSCGGIVFPSSDFVCLADAIKRLIFDDMARKVMSINAHNYAKRELSAQKQSKLLENLLIELALR